MYQLLDQEKTDTIENRSTERAQEFLGNPIRSDTVSSNKNKQRIQASNAYNTYFHASWEKGVASFGLRYRLCGRNHSVCACDFTSLPISCTGVATFNGIPAINYA